jgi:hypothetical protein
VPAIAIFRAISSHREVIGRFIGMRV